MIDQDISIYCNTNIYDFDNNIIMNYYPRRIIELSGDSRKKCLELGVGYGTTTEIFSQYFNRHVSLDGDKDIIERYKKMFPDTKAEVIQTYFEEWDTDERFDVIVLGFVLEHVEDPGGILERYAGFLAPEGKMYITVPNAEALNRRIGLEAGVLADILKLSETDIRFGHKRYYTLKTLRKEILRGGMKITREEGLFLKPVTTAQMISLNLTENIIQGFLKVGRYYPELCLGLLLEAEAI